MASAQQHPGIQLRRMDHNLFNELRLSNAWLTDDDHELTRACTRLAQSLMQCRQFAVPANERSLSRADCRWDGNCPYSVRPRSVRFSASTVAVGVEGPVNLSRLGLRLNAELAPEHGDALPVLPEGGVPPGR